MFGLLLFCLACAGMTYLGFKNSRDYRKAKARREAIKRIARKSEELGEYNKFIA